MKLYPLKKNAVHDAPNVNKQDEGALCVGLTSESCDTVLMYHINTVSEQVLQKLPKVCLLFKKNEFCCCPDVEKII